MLATEPPAWLVITRIDLFVLFHSSLSTVAGVGSLRQTVPALAVSICPPCARKEPQRACRYSRDGGGDSEASSFTWQVISGEFFGWRQGGGWEERRPPLLLSDGGCLSSLVAWPGDASLPPFSPAFPVPPREERWREHRGRALPHLQPSAKDTEDPWRGRGSSGHAWPGRHDRCAPKPNPRPQPPSSSVPPAPAAEGRSVCTFHSSLELGPFTTG